MEELKYIQSERKLLKSKYLEDSKDIWTKYEGLEADRKHRKAYKEYQNKDYFLSCLEARLEDILKEIEYYKEK